MVYVLNKSGKPLAPTKRYGHVRILLKQKKAVVVRTRPFTIRLKYETPDKVPDIYGSTDPGRTNIGNAAVTTEGECIYRDKVETRNKDVPENMKDRKKHRRVRRRGERLVRKRRAKKHGTLSTKLGEGRLIPGTEKPTPVKDIINTESRFMNRKKRQPLTPTVRHLIDTTLNQIDNIRSIIPVKGWCFEINKFAFMKMKDGSVRGVDFQNGRLKTYSCVNDYVYARQKGKCFCCGKPIEHFHHVVPSHMNGFDGPENKIGVCGECHSAHHKGELEFDVEGFQKKYAALSVLNQAIPYIYKGLIERFGKENVYICEGDDTYVMCHILGLEKDHDIDAICIAACCLDIELKAENECFTVKQFRRHDRAFIKSQPERTYKIGKDTVAKNRTPRFEQKGPALSQWYEKQVSMFGKREADKMRSQLTLKPSYRRYNDPSRVMPGTLIRHKTNVFVMTSQQNNGCYYRHKGKLIPSKECTIIKHNTGLVYM